MRPKPFNPQLLNEDGPYVKDLTTGLVWHRTPHRTLYADTDRSQVVYHSNYLKYFEQGRASLMRDVAYSYREIEESGYVYPIIEIHAGYFAPLYYDDCMWIHTRPATLDRVKLQFDYVITSQEYDKIICKGYTRHCAINTAGIPVAVDEKTVRVWTEFPGAGNQKA
ncbi:MAG: thioesterase family protein [Pseudomonadota bacterium]